MPVLTRPGVLAGVAAAGGLGEQAEAAVVAAAGAGLAIEARHRLHVVGEDLRGGAEDDVERVRHAAEVGGEHLDGAGRVPRVHGRDHPRPVARAAVRQVVAVDRGEHGVAQPHHRDRLGHVRRAPRDRGRRAGGPRSRRRSRSGGCRRRRGS